MSGFFFVLFVFLVISTLFSFDDLVSIDQVCESSDRNEHPLFWLSIRTPEVLFVWMPKPWLAQITSNSTYTIKYYYSYYTLGYWFYVSIIREITFHIGCVVLQKTAT